MAEAGAPPSVPPPPMAAPPLAWPGTLNAPVATAIPAALTGSRPPQGERVSDTGADRADDTALLMAVRRLLDDRANPAIAGHGGEVTAESVTGGVVYLRMSGGCQGCASAQMTLRRGVATMLCAALPAICGIVDLTDHASGTDPFYRRRGGPSPVLSRPVPPGALSLVSGRVRVDPAFLAPRLGLTVEDVRAGLERGGIAVERHPGAGSGSSRIVFRGPARAWAAEIASDGAAHEIPPPRPTGATDPVRAELAARLRRHLEALAAGAELPSYGTLARALGLTGRGAVGRVTAALELTMREDARAGRPFIAARAVSRATGMPGQGFFALARALGRGPRSGEPDAAFHRRCLAD